MIKNSALMSLLPSADELFKNLFQMIEYISRYICARNTWINIINEKMIRLWDKVNILQKYEFLLSQKEGGLYSSYVNFDVAILPFLVEKI